LANLDGSLLAGDADANYPHLFSSLQLGTLRLRNRIAFASMFSGRPRNGDVTPELITFYANRAAGGAALVVTEPLSALRNVDLFAGQVRVHQRQDIDGLSRWAETVRQHDSSIVAQL
jgi:2,4-dienoyl-CoA reductase-like NADH-dependent reductase (Old Yellow Enzyme family)